MKKISDEMVKRINKVMLIDEILVGFIWDENLNRKCCFNSTEKNCEIQTDKEKQIFRCNKCAEGGDAVILVMKSLNLSYPDALLWLQNRYDLKEGIPSNEEIAMAAESAFICVSEIGWEHNIIVDEDAFFDGFNFGVNYCIEFIEEYQRRLNKND